MADYKNFGIIPYRPITIPTYSLREVPLNISVPLTDNIMPSITRAPYSYHDIANLKLPADFTSRVLSIKPTDTCVITFSVTLDFKATMANGLTYRYSGGALFFTLDHGKTTMIREAVFHTSSFKGFLSYTTYLSNNNMEVKASLQVEPRIMSSHTDIDNTLGKVMYNLPIKLSSQYKDVPQVFDTSKETVTEYSSMEITVRSVNMSMNFSRVTYELDRR